MAGIDEELYAAATRAYPKYGGGGVGRGGMTLTGDKKLIAKFQALPMKLQRKGLRRGVTKAARGVVRAAKKECPKETKLLSQSLGLKAYTRRDKMGVGAVIGVRKGYYRGVVRKRGGFRKSRKSEAPTAFRNPEKYLHLVILGTKHSRANNFLLRAAQRTQAQSVQTIRGEIVVQLETETAKR